MRYDFYTFDQLDTKTLYDILSHRFEVFVLGQRCIYHDYDAFDMTGIHLTARDDAGNLVGYCRLIPAEQHYEGYAEHSFGRLSVKESSRKAGVGGELVRQACRYLTALGDCRSVRISAMAYLEKFYTELGFQRVSDVFDKEGVPHVTMLYTAPDSQ